jgi:hypothetical protein
VRRGSLFIVLFILLIFSPRVAQCGLSHLDSVLAEALPSMVQSSSLGPMTVSADSTIQPLLHTIPKAVGLCLPIFYISHIHAIVDTQNSEMQIILDGEILTPGRMQSQRIHQSKTVGFRLLPDDIIAIRLNQEHYNYKTPTSSWEGDSTHSLTGIVVTYNVTNNPVNTPQRSVWADVLEPALVILGAAAIVALFFLLRS